MFFRKIFLAGALGAFCTLAVQLDYPVHHQLTFRAAKAGIVLGYASPTNRSLLQRTIGRGGIARLLARSRYLPTIVRT
ncbi:MAG: hypothetical protein N4J56_006696 [Chroococcidiopsis sp. SAG 2025]|uniref:hypothetical protein n=1 Tax=Chroococcidiopsis sp. SAG 2025 TaxID=171389 RepID=UPI0029373DD6|nr:hypothetical protein [Chroococcidiopsis sp. SAG 2025]MDV2996991.1 hypothetical protein [Chroococcidiopsis sp. SAG 2025]